MSDQTASVTPVVETAVVAPTGLSRLWRRELNHYPPTKTRYRLLLLVVLSSVVM